MSDRYLSLSQPWRKATSMGTLNSDQHSNESVSEVGAKIPDNTIEATFLKKVKNLKPFDRKTSLTEGDMDSVEMSANQVSEKRKYLPEKQINTNSGKVPCKEINPILNNSSSTAGHLLVRPVDLESRQAINTRNRTKSTPSSKRRESYRETMSLQNTHSSGCSHRDEDLFPTTEHQLQSGKKVQPLTPVAEIPEHSNNSTSGNKLIMLLSGYDESMIKRGHVKNSSISTTVRTSVESTKDICRSIVESPVNSSMQHWKKNVEETAQINSNLTISNVQDEEVPSAATNDESQISLRKIEQSATRRDPPKKRPENRIIPVSIEESSPSDDIKDETKSMKENRVSLQLDHSYPEVSEVSAECLNNEASQVTRQITTKYLLPEVTPQVYPSMLEQIPQEQPTNSATTDLNNQQSRLQFPTTENGSIISHRETYMQELHRHKVGRSQYIEPSKAQLYNVQVPLLPASVSQVSQQNITHASLAETRDDESSNDTQSKHIKKPELFEQNITILPHSIIEIKPDHQSLANQPELGQQTVYLIPASNLEIPVATNDSFSLLHEGPSQFQHFTTNASLPKSHLDENGNERSNSNYAVERGNDVDMQYTMLEEEASIKHELTDQLVPLFYRQESTNEAIDLTVPKDITDLGSSASSVASSSRSSSPGSHRSRHDEVTSSNDSFDDKEVLLTKIRNQEVEIFQLKAKLSKLEKIGKKNGVKSRKRPSNNSLEDLTDSAIKTPRIKMTACDSSTFSVENQDFQEELTPESGVFIKKSQLTACLLKSRDSPTMLMRFLLDIFFSTEELANSSAVGRGHAGRPALPANTTRALISYIRRKYSQCTDGDMIQAINQKCTDARKVIRKKHNLCTS